MISISTVRSEKDILDILSLLNTNLRQNLSLDRQISDGFVSIDYSYDILRKMNQKAPSIIAKDSTSKLVGYSITMLPEFAVEVSTTDELLSLINTLEYEGKPLKSYNYYIMGQACVDKEYRGQMIFDQMLHKHRELYGDRYELLITAISNKNPRSFRAHARVGFKTIHSFSDSKKDETWNIVLWDWRT